MTYSTKSHDESLASQAPAALWPHLQCPACRQPMRGSGSVGQPYHCFACGFSTSGTAGIWRGLTPDREAYFRQFVEQYAAVRANEGRGSTSPEYYLALPFEDLTGNNSWQWRIRGRTFRYLEKHLLPKIERAYPDGCDVLDIGAGNCWLSFRMALRGHRPVAVDLLDNDSDGLGAAKHYLNQVPRPFLRFQAEMDRLPFADGQFDVVIFNASFHYSADYERTLAEALRCLRRPGSVIIADSAFYRREESGRAMLAERRALFERQYGFRSDSIPSREYLTPQTLDQLAKSFALQWRLFKPWYGMGWALRPLKARLARRREPSRFYLLWAQVAS